MAKKEEEKPKQDAPAPDQAQAKKGGSKKLLIAVAVAMVVQGGAVFMLARMTGPKPAAAEVSPAEGEAAHDEEKTVEVALVDEKFQNMQSGRAFIWDTAIVLKVREKDEELVTQTLTTRAAEVKEGIALIFRRAPHTQLTEPGLETINRQLHAYLTEVLGKDAQGHSRVLRVLIPKCKGFPAD